MSTKRNQIALLIAAMVCTGWAHSELPMTTRNDLGENFDPRGIGIPAEAFAHAFAESVGESGVVVSERITDVGGFNESLELGLDRRGQWEIHLRNPGG